MLKINQFFVSVLLISFSLRATVVINESQSALLITLASFGQDQFYYRLEPNRTVSIAVHLWKDAEIRNITTQRLYVFHNLINHPRIRIKDESGCRTLCDWLRQISS